jgi:hypothetical protein
VQKRNIFESEALIQPKKVKGQPTLPRQCPAQQCGPRSSGAATEWSDARAWDGMREQVSESYTVPSEAEADERV